MKSKFNTNYVKNLKLSFKAEQKLANIILTYLQENLIFHLNPSCTVSSAFGKEISHQQ